MIGMTLFSYEDMIIIFTEGNATEGMISILLYRKFLVRSENGIILSDSGKKLIENMA